MRPTVASVLIIALYAVSGLRFYRQKLHQKSRNGISNDTIDEFAPNIGGIRDRVEAPVSSKNAFRTMAQDLGITPYTVAGFAFAIAVISLNAFLGQGWAANMLGWNTAAEIESSATIPDPVEMERLRNSAILNIKDISERMDAYRAAHER